MKAKPYTNFKVSDTFETAQEPVKTDAAKIEAIRQEQMTKPVETFPAHVRRGVTDSNGSFNDWVKHIGKLIK